MVSGGCVCTILTIVMQTNSYTYPFNVVCLVGICDGNRTAAWNQIHCASLAEDFVAHVEVELHVALGKRILSARVEHKCEQWERIQ